MRVKRKNRVVLIFSLCLGLAIVFSTFAVGKAFAWSTKEWRPSIEIKKELEVQQNKIAEDQKSIEFFNGIVRDYETNKDSFTENIHSVEGKYNYLHDYINEERDNIEGQATISYASYLAKTLLEDVVGNKIITDAIFRLGIVNYVLSLEDEAIEKLLNDYHSVETDLNDAISDEQKAEQMYTKAKADIELCNQEIAQLNESVVYWNGILPDIYEIEAELGAGGESCLSGNGFFNNPLPNGQPSSYFGEAREEGEGDSGGPVHQGLDLAASTGDPIYAADDGEVIAVSYSEENSPNSGLFVCLKHSNGLVTYYRHCSEVFVPLGVFVHRGDNIALVGNTGESFGPHLHFQVELNNVPVDPLDYLNGPEKD